MRFYLKRGGWGWSIYHRLSHCFVAGFEEIEEAAEFIEELNKQPVEDIWTFLIATRYVRLPRKEVIKGAAKDSSYADQERSYTQAWKTGTDAFYEEYPHLLVEEPLDYELYQRISRKVREAKQQEQDELRRRKNAKKVFRSFKDGIIKLHIKRLA